MKLFVAVPYVASFLPAVFVPAATASEILTIKLRRRHVRSPSAHLLPLFTFTPLLSRQSTHSSLKTHPVPCPSVPRLSTLPPSPGASFLSPANIHLHVHPHSHSFLHTLAAPSHSLTYHPSLIPSFTQSLTQPFTSPLQPSFAHRRHHEVNQ